ncbi:hypothetical protein FRC09_009209 [Ceratobasidium sp. 395]|nr:hypothetical protein FRC09_009209 [Ceratobasidium sp. 395]
MALPQAPVDYSTQTVTETESYETLRPSQSVSQVRCKADAVGAPAINGASRFNYRLPSPPTTFEHQAATWQNDWIESRSVSQAHDEQFEALYPLPPTNDAS